eukprot:CAMPEP_0175997124 /NCGR_PEP_ID=MMETSP0108-20121206/56035_1 /TAXON_ID=195067 ORGANISM="Goniomonas pacifica, Strain CCMP1869" /NCGR_SAMPLE_ID=MMETSP0108 /ASSEMBLY_ACC=CAM_ASM_000204 /LENGTH=39 /DNA_ID= /DNA_START= /DNA_END= /DNA_ORIENTATION=
MIVAHPEGACQMAQQAWGMHMRRSSAVCFCTQFVQVVPT